MQTIQHWSSNGHRAVGHERYALQEIDALVAVTRKRPPCVTSRCSLVDRLRGPFGKGAVDLNRASYAEP